MKFLISNFQFPIILTVILFGVLFLPSVSLATHGDRIVPCGYNDTNPCQIKHIFTLIKNLTIFLVVHIMPYVAVLMLLIGGVIFLFGGGSPELKNWGKNIIKTTIIGLAIALLAYAIIRAILVGLGYYYEIPSL